MAARRGVFVEADGRHTRWNIQLSAGVIIVQGISSTFICLCLQTTGDRQRQPEQVRVWSKGVNLLP